MKNLSFFFKKILNSLFVKKYITILNSLFVKKIERFFVHYKIKDVGTNIDDRFLFCKNKNN
jgi:hypothetical protein